MFGLTWESSVRWGKRKTLRNKWKRRGVTGCTGCLTARLQLHKIWPSTGGKEKQIFMGGFTVSKILGVDKVPCGWEKSRREKSLGFIWGLVSLSTSWESLKGPSRWVEENSDGGQPDIHHLCCFRARQYTLQRKPLKESCVCWCARAKRLQLCTILSMSQRLRSLKITRRDRCGLRLIFFFFHSPLFVIRCQQNFLGVQTMAFMSGVSHGPMAYRAAHSNTMQSSCKGKYTMSVCSLLAQAWIHIYLSTMSFTRKGFFLVFHSWIKVKIKQKQKVFLTYVQRPRKSKLEYWRDNR